MARSTSGAGFTFNRCSIKIQSWSAIFGAAVAVKEKSLCTNCTCQWSTAGSTIFWTIHTFASCGGSLNLEILFTNVACGSGWAFITVLLTPLTSAICKSKLAWGTVAKSSKTRLFHKKSCAINACWSVWACSTWSRTQLTSFLHRIRPRTRCAFSTRSKIWASACFTPCYTRGTSLRIHVSELTRRTIRYTFTIA